MGRRPLPRTGPACTQRPARVSRRPLRREHLEPHRIRPLAALTPPCLPGSPPHGVRPVLLARVFEKQRRGVLHVHPVLGVKTPAERHAAHLYARYLSQLADRYGFGYTERKIESRSSKRIAGYLSSYFIHGKHAS